MGTLKWMMVTLVLPKGKESIARDIIERIKSQAALKGMHMVSGGARTEHYHILCKENEWDNLIIEKWPGIVKRNAITESQANFVRQIHESCYSVTNGPQQGGYISTSIESSSSSGDARMKIFDASWRVCKAESNFSDSSGSSGISKDT